MKEITRKIQVLGLDRKQCKEAADNAASAAGELGIKHQVEQINDISEFINFDIVRSSTPALAVDGKVKVAGRVPGKDEIKNILSK